MTKSYKNMNLEELIDEKYRILKLLNTDHNVFTQKQNRKALSKINALIYKIRVGR